MMTGILVRRVGNVLSGYITRCAVVVLSTLACWTDRKAWISFVGCGVVWSLAELSIEGQPHLGLKPRSDTLHFPAPRTAGAEGLKTSRPKTRPSESTAAFGPSKELILGAVFV